LVRRVGKARHRFLALEGRCLRRLELRFGSGEFRRGSKGALSHHQSAPSGATASPKGQEDLKVPKYTGALRRLERSTRSLETDRNRYGYWIAIGQRQVVMYSVGMHEGLGAKPDHDLRFCGNDVRRMEALRELTDGLKYCASKERVLPNDETVIDRIVNEGAEALSFDERRALVDSLAASEVLPALRNLHRTRESFKLMLAVIRRMYALEARIGVADIEWFIQVALEVTDWTIQYEGDTAGYAVSAEIADVLADEAAAEMKRRLEAYEFGRMRSLLAVKYEPKNHHAPEGRTVSQLVAALSPGGVEAALKPLPETEVNWYTLVCIANRLTNGLLRSKDENGNVPNLDLAHMNDGFSDGAVREFDLEVGARPGWIDAGWNGGEGWYAFRQRDVSRLEWISYSSGSRLVATKQAKNKWNLVFVPSCSQPMYRGYYYQIWENPEGVENLRYQEQCREGREQAPQRTKKQKAVSPSGPTLGDILKAQMEEANSK
jgi:hypothetical protein